MKVALYARVSTLNGMQDPETQLIALRDYCKQRGWEIIEEYVDKGFSGAKESRPALNRLMLDAKRCKFDAVLVWKLDRFGRSLRHLVNSLAEFEALGIAFVSMTDSLDMTTPQGRLMFGIISAMTEFERALIVERVKAGMRRVKAEGSRTGRAIGRPRAREFDVEAIKARVASGEQRQHIAAELGVSPALITKRLKAAS
jgi:DNA invertase Pin-like site-specific DNA recombinase